MASAVRSGDGLHRDDDSQCCSHHHEVHVGEDADGWVRALAVATFDVGTGHTLEQVYPPDSLDEGDRQRIRMLAMPDCNTTQIGDCFYCFRTRKSHRLPLLSSSLLDQHFEYCYAFFRQERNEECARGMFQKSVVLVTRYPYVNLFERLVKVIGPLYFTHGPAVLEAVFASIESWPAPCPGSLCPLPFLGETVMFQVPEIDMPPQVASKYRYHRGVHLCALWPRSRVKTLTRTLSGCGSMDLTQTSPSARRLSQSLVAPDGGAALADGGYVDKHPPANAESAQIGNRASFDDGGDGQRSLAGKPGVQATPGGLYASPENAATAAEAVVGDVDNDEWEHIKGLNTPDRGTGHGGRNPGSGSVFWSGSARSPGVLVPPRFQLAIDGVDEGHPARTSSIGSLSLASVVCDSPSESWLTTPRSKSTPLLALKSSAGSNLAQSCYYVADRDSEDEGHGESDSSDSEAEQWLEGEGSWERENEHQDQGAQRDSQDRDDVVGEAGHMARQEGIGGGVGQEEVVSRRQESPEADGASAPPFSEGETRARRAMGEQIKAEPEASPPAASEDVAVVCRSDDGAGVVAVLGAASVGPADPARVTQQEQLPPSPPPPPPLPLPPSQRNVAPSPATDAAADAAAADAGAGLAQVPADSNDSRRPPPLEQGRTRSTGQRTGEPNRMVRERAISHSPPRSTLQASPAPKPSQTSQTPNPSVRKRWSGLRAWADAAPEDPWDAPPPLATDYAEPTWSKSRSAAVGGQRSAAGEAGVTVMSPLIGLPKASNSGTKDGAAGVGDDRQRQGSAGHGPCAQATATATATASAVPTSADRAARRHLVQETGSTSRVDRTRGPERGLSPGGVTGATWGSDRDGDHKDGAGKMKNGCHVSKGHLASQARRPRPAQDGEETRAGATAPARDRASADRASGTAARDGSSTGNVGSARGARTTDDGEGKVQTGSERTRSDVTGARGVSGRGRDGGTELILAEASAEVSAGTRSNARLAESGAQAPPPPAAAPAAAAVAAANGRATGTAPERAAAATGMRSVAFAGKEEGSHAFAAAAAGESRAWKEEQQRRAVGEKGDADGVEGAGGVEGGGAAGGKGSARPLVRKSSGSFRLSHDGRVARPPSLAKSSTHDRRSIHRSASNLKGGRSPFAEMLLADEARFRAKQGLFQSIGLYSIFGKKLVEHLWLLWELVITGSPTLVVGSSVGASSAAILGMVSLASPVYFCGDFRPHFTTFDPDYRQIVNAHDKVSKQQGWGSSVLGVPGTGLGADASGGFPHMLLGVINPIFLRSLSRWPNAIVLPGAAGRGLSSSTPAGARKLPRDFPQDASPGSPKNKNCPTNVTDGLAAVRPAAVRVQVVRAAAGLEQVVAAIDRPDEPIIVSRQQPVMVPDVSVLSRLLDPATPYNPATAAAAAAAASTPVHGRPPTPLAGVVAAASAAAAAEAAGSGKGGSETKGQWKDSLRAINDIILRRHFADLTRSFLAPFDVYFRRSRPPQSLTVWQQRALGRLSVYTGAELLLPKFDEEEFMTEMFVAGPPKSFAHVQWETLYRRFMDSPNFRPWFTTQRIEAVERIREMNRAVCLRTTPQGMVEACAPARLPQLLLKMKAAIAREWQREGRDVDWELLERMERHQKAVEEAIAAYESLAAAATGSVQP